jgi:molybdopterin-containing oxidoreductase family iron-sulfur binding subunit
MVAVLYPKAAILDGRHAENPWLQELPDPVTKAVWDNYACLSPATAGRLSLDDGDVVRIRAGADGPALELPVLVQPGQHDRVVAVAIGYGRAGTERFAAIGPDWLEARPTVAAGARVGVRAAPLMELSGGRLVSDRTGVTLAPAGRKADLARSQHWHTLVPPEQVAGKNAPPRDMVRETTLAAWRRDPSAGSHGTHGPAAGGGMWAADFPYEGHHWDMAIDLSACTGCASCVIACQAENNIPVVGKDEIRRSREMQWLRVDRYFSGEGEGTAISHQPLPCQHCDHAPCESVCPVLATVHSEEGLNQQVYNRCVGTRYCANNCPYKVRRFNWFTYSRENPIENLVLNPDVTVRTRGVMEKCTFCVQRIQEARAEARREGRPIRDGDVTPACAQSCPAGAIVFGDGNDAGSRVSQAMKSPRAYRLLEELNTRPSVAYLTVVRDRQETNAESRRTHG